MTTFSVDGAEVTFENGCWTCSINGNTYTNGVSTHVLPVNTVFLEVTTQCNLSCTYCYQKNNRTQNLAYSHAKN
jgi:sulfatase maturation enzyme AslB (radical SAM superfamily)